MDNQVTNFKTLEQRLTEKLIERGNAFNTIRNTRYVCHRLQREFIRRGCDYFSLPVALSILTDVRASGVSKRYCRTLHTVISRFDMLSRGQWDDRITVDNSVYSVSDDQEELVKGYLAHCRMNGLRETTIRIKRTAILVFFTAMNAQGCHNICLISPEIICKICTGVNNKNLWGEFRMFLRYLSESGILDRDYSLAVPHRRKPQIIPPLYTDDEIAATENAIDRSTAIGKRNYAMVLLASRLGMRSGDIVRLTFQNFTAVDRHIQFIQEKTGKEQVVFLPDDVYTAVHDYISVRPAADTDAVFLTHMAPHKKVTTGCLRYMISKYMKQAGIDISGRRHGPHALRASLASSMIKDKVSYETVRRILGHSSRDAMKHYARIDINVLREYSLDVPDASGHFADLISGIEG